MQKIIKIILDSNVIISGLLFQGVVENLLHFDHALEKSFEVYTSKFIIDELVRVLEKKFKVDQIIIQDLFELISQTTVLTPKSIEKICRDPKDNHLLDLSRESNADFLITGDKDLLVIKKFRNTQIVTPSKFHLYF